MSTAQQLMDMEHLMFQPEFRRFLLRVFEEAHILQSTYSADARSSAHAEGQRALGLTMMDWANAVRPDALIAVLSETKSVTLEQQNGKRRYDSRNDESDDADA